MTRATPSFKLILSSWSFVLAYAAKPKAETNHELNKGKADQELTSLPIKAPFPQQLEGCSVVQVVNPVHHVRPHEQPLGRVLEHAGQGDASHGGGGQETSRPHPLAVLGQALGAGHLEGVAAPAGEVLEPHSGGGKHEGFEQARTREGTGARPGTENLPHKVPVIHRHVGSVDAVKTGEVFIKEVFSRGGILLLPAPLD